MFMVTDKGVVAVDAPPTIGNNYLKGAKFITEPKDHGLEIRCYMHDPDGYIIEVGQTTGGLKDIKTMR
jgi:hypothetical protein